jgi:undecaprenyl pyrophosphate phosphatase UppP
VTTHFTLLLVFSFLVALVFAVLMKDDAREQLRFGGLVFGGFVLTALVLGWVMYPFPR